MTAADPFVCDVSVIVPALNAGRTIAASLASVFAQTLQPREVIVVDRGSMDDTEARVRDWGARVVYVRQPDASMSRAWNEGIARASSRFVAFLESGDLWLPRKLERQMSYFDCFPATGLLHSASLASPSPTRAAREMRDEDPLDVVGSAPVLSSAAPGPIQVTAAIAPRTVVVGAGGFEERDNAEAARQLWRRIALSHPIGHQGIVLVVRRTERPPVRAERGGNLVHDTMCRRARDRAARVIHRMDDALSRVRRSHARVLFEAASPVSVAVFRPVYERLRRDPRIEFWFTTSDGSWDANRIFGPAGLGHRTIPAREAAWKKFDAYINTDFWNMTWLHRSARRIHLFHGVAGKYGLDAPVRIAPVVATYDRLLFPNRDRLARYADAGLIDPDGPCGALVGYPKVDCLVDGSLDRGAIERSLGLDPRKPTVLYAPTWSPYSSLNAMGEAIIRALLRTDANVVVKLHDRSCDGTARASGGIDWRLYLDRLCRAWHVHLADDADASPYLVAADVLVTDHSSVGFEFMLLDRPIVVLDCPQLIEKARVNPDKVASLRRAADVVPNAREVTAAVRRALDAPRDRGEQRRAIAADLFYGPGGASARAAQCIYDVLDVSAPAQREEAALELAPAFTTFQARTN